MGGDIILGEANSRTAAIEDDTKAKASYDRREWVDRQCCQRWTNWRARFPGPQLATLRSLLNVGCPLCGRRVKEVTASTAVHGSTGWVSRDSGGGGTLCD